MQKTTNVFVEITGGKKAILQDIDGFINDRFVIRTFTEKMWYGKDFSKSTQNNLWYIVDKRDKTKTAIIGLKGFKKLESCIEYFRKYIIKETLKEIKQSNLLFEILKREE